MTVQKATNIKGHHGKITRDDRVKPNETKRGDDMAYRPVRFRESPPLPLNFSMPSSRTNTRHTYLMATTYDTRLE